jgi:hypothetical protein
MLPGLRQIRSDMRSGYFACGSMVLAILASSSFLRSASAKMNYKRRKVPLQSTSRHCASPEEV